MSDLYAAVLANSYLDPDGHHFLEFVSLLDTAGYHAAKGFRQSVETIDKAIYCGKGKLEEIHEYIASNNANPEKDRVSFLACDFELTGAMKKNIEKAVGVPVIDRTMVILEIFERNAKTREAMLQVDIAKLHYLKAHLVDNQASYSQVTSGSGHNKGEGEKKIELNRRKIDHMIDMKKKELETAVRSRRNMRNRRKQSPVPKIAIVGYTNAGKSTLTNRLMEFASSHPEKLVLSENRLFATLETSTRLIDSFRYPSLLVTDTVGFVSDLPVYLIDAFKATLEEVKEADLIVHVVDVSSPYHQEQIEVTENILRDIGVSDIPTVFLLNKYDALPDGLGRLPRKNELFTSLVNGEDTEDILRFLCKSLSSKWEKKTFLLPYEVNFHSFLKDNYVRSYEQKENGYLVTASLNPLTLYKYQDFLIPVSG